ncbi:MAG: hypothetical protein AAF449_21925, partial [Myxococcota bacterium]
GHSGRPAARCLGWVAWRTVPEGPGRRSLGGGNNLRYGCSQSAVTADRSASGSGAKNTWQ